MQQDHQEAQINSQMFNRFSAMSSGYEGFFPDKHFCLHI